MSKHQKKHQQKDTATAATPASENKEVKVNTNIATASTSPADISFLPIFVQRVTPTVVSSFLSTAKGYYETSKAKYPTIAAAENNFIKLSSPVIEKVKPTINELDQFGCKQLDKIESKVNSSKKKIESIYKPAEQAFESTKVFVYDNIVNTKPVNQALEITEYAVDKILPSPNKKVAEESISTGNLDANARFTRLRSKTFDKLKSLQPLSEEKIKSLTHSVSLIEYASKYIDVNQTVEKAKEFINAPIQKSTEYIKSGVNLVLEAKITKSVESIAIDGYNRVKNTAETVYNATPIQKSRNLIQDSVNYVLSSKVTQSVESVAKEGIHKAVGIGKYAITLIPKPVLDKVESTYSVVIIKVPYAEKAVSTLQSYLAPLLATAVPSDD